MSNKIRDFFEERFPKSMSRGQQSPADYLARNGWEPQEKQQGAAVFKCPVTGSNFLEAEALRRAEACPFEDRAAVILGRVIKESEKARAANAQLMTEVREATEDKQAVAARVDELMQEIGALKAAKSPVPAAPAPPAPAPGATAPKPAGR